MLNVVEASPEVNATYFLDGLTKVPESIFKTFNDTEARLQNAEPDSSAALVLKDVVSWLHDIICQIGRGEEPELTYPDYISPSMYIDVVDALWDCTTKGDSACRANKHGVCQVCCTVGLH